MTTNLRFPSPLLNFSPDGNPSCAGRFFSPPIEPSPSLAVTTIVSAVLDMLSVQKESGQGEL
jgi:hypothetical protein